MKNFTFYAIQNVLGNSKNVGVGRIPHGTHVHKMGWANQFFQQMLHHSFWGVEIPHGKVFFGLFDKYVPTWAQSDSAILPGQTQIHDVIGISRLRVNSPLLKKS